MFGLGAPLITVSVPLLVTLHLACTTFLGSLQIPRPGYSRLGLGFQTRLSPFPCHSSGPWLLCPAYSRRVPCLFRREHGDIIDGVCNGLGRVRRVGYCSASFHRSVGLFLRAKSQDKMLGNVLDWVPIFKRSSSSSVFAV